MQVAKYWRNRKLRYRLVRNTERYGNLGSLLKPQGLGGKSPEKKLDVARVKVLS